jgi:hypothetical protein
MMIADVLIQHDMLKVEREISSVDLPCSIIHPAVSSLLRTTIPFLLYVFADVCYGHC